MIHGCRVLIHILKCIFQELSAPASAHHPLGRFSDRTGPSRSRHPADTLSHRCVSALVRLGITASGTAPTLTHIHLLPPDLGVIPPGRRGVDVEMMWHVTAIHAVVHDHHFDFLRVASLRVWTRGHSNPSQNTALAHQPIALKEKKKERKKGYNVRTVSVAHQTIRIPGILD